MADIITVEQMQNASTDCQTLSDVISGAPDTQVRSRLGRMIWTIATINSKIESVRVASDNAKTTMTGYVTSVEQAKTQAQTDINNKVAAVYGGYFAAFDTLANLQASTGAKTGQVAKVMNDTLANNGDYRYNGTAWVKGYDALTDAKNYTDSRTAYTYEYVDGNKIGPKTPTYTNLGVDSILAISAVTYFDSVVLRVNEGDVLYLLNDKQNYQAANGSGFAFFANDPNINRTQTRITDNRISRTDTATALVHQIVIVPTGAKYLMLNTRFTNVSNVRTDFTWTVNSGAFSNNYTAGKEVITAINGVSVPNYNTVNKQIDAKIGIKTEYVNGNETANAVAFKNLGVGASYEVSTTSNYEAMVLEVTQNDILYILNDLQKYNPYTDGISFAFYAKDPSVNTTQKYIADNRVRLTDSATNLTYYKVTVPTGAKYLMLTTRFLWANGSTTKVTWTVHKNKFSASYDIGVLKNTALNGLGFYIKSDANYLTSKYENAWVYCFGDSITQGTEGGYVQYLVQKLGCYVSNQGSGGGTASRMVDIVTYGSNLPKRDVDTASINWGVKDYTLCKAVTMQIGTNDYLSGSIDDIPSGDISDYTDPLDYWALFPRNYVANIALCIEFIRSKNSDCDIFLITPPFRNSGTSDTPSYKEEVVTYLRQIADFYAVTLINARHESGVGFKFMRPKVKYSYDGTHFNSAGNKKWGEYIAKRMLDTMR